MFDTWHGTPWMWLSMVVFWSLFVVFLYYMLRGRASSGSGPSSARATEILAERFARGDISADEFRESRDIIETTGARRDVT